MQTSEAVAIIHRGIHREKEAIAAYLAFAKAVKDPKAKNVLIHLASDEVGHMSKLEKHLMAVLKGDPWVLPKAGEIEAVAAAFVSGGDPPMEIRKADLEKADVLRILEVGVEREVVANRFYLDLASKAKTPEAKELFLSMAGEEALHMKVLRAEIDAIGRTGFWFDMREFTGE